jgi:predicted porin
LHAATNNTYDAVLSTTGTIWGSSYSSVAAYNSRLNNSVAFTSANYGGVSGAVVIAAGEGPTGTRTASLNVMYAAGPVLAGFAHQSEKTGNATLKNNLIAGSYDFGMAKLTAGYQSAKNGQAGTDAAEDKEVQLGVSVPFGAASIAAGVTRSESEDSVGATQSKATGVSLIGLYDLSKRTALYAGLNATKKDNAAGVEVLKDTNAQVGIRHKF